MPSLLAESAPARTRVTTDTRKRFFRELEGPAQIVSNLTPNWFASIMGTGIVAVAAASLPLQFPGLRTAATVVWAIAAVLLVSCASNSLD